MSEHPPTPDPAAAAAPRIRTGDRAAAPATARLPVTVVLDHLRSAHNVGNIFRLVDAVGGEGIVACGYTAAPPHPKLAKTARGCDALVPCAQAAAAPQAVAELKARGYTVYLVDTVEGAQAPWEVEFRFPAALVLGNEALGCDPAALALCDGAIALPGRGLKNSINVGNCAAVVLFAALRQWLKTSGGDPS